MVELEDMISDYQGQLLLATPKMSDFRFDKSVILICSHTSDGAMGIIVNKPTLELKFEDVLNQLKISSKGIGNDHKIFFGGPVEYGRGFVVHSPDYDCSDASITIRKEYFLTANKEILKDMANGCGPKNSLLALGYAGWGPGQLESEIFSDSWLICDPDPDLVFSLQPESIWKNSLKKLGVNPSHLSAYGGSA